MSEPGTRRFICFYCGTVYDEALGWPEVPPGSPSSDQRMAPLFRT